MFAQLFDSFRKASEASMQAQQEIFKQWIQQWPPMSFNAPSPAGEWGGAAQQRWLDATRETLNKQRELLDSTYRSGIEMIEQTFRAGEAKSPEEYRGMVEDLWRKLSDAFKMQSESQFREFQNAMQKWFELARNGATLRES